MNKILFVFFFSIVSVAYGQSSYERFLKCQRTAINNFGTNREQCRGISTRFEQSKCLSTLYRKFSIDSCSQALSNQLNSISFMYKELSEIDNPLNNKVYSTAQREQIYKQLMTLIEEEINLVVTIFDKELDSRESQFFTERSNRNFNRALSILGAQVQNSSNSSTNQTFIINGRIINCSSYQNITNCN
jgi:hypothetical protein